MKNSNFHCNSQYDSLYQWAKIHILQNTHTLCYFDPDLPVSLETDVSQSDLGAILLQHGRQFMSKTLTETQSRYSNIEHEILGVVTGVEHFYSISIFIWQTIHIYTDHKPIESLVLKPVVDTSPIIQCLMLMLTQYHINVEYKSGKSLFLSD